MDINIKKFETDYFQKLRNLIDEKYQNDINLLDEKLEKFKNKNYDKIYLISSIKDINISKTKLKISYLYEELASKKNSNNSQSIDGQISKEELEVKNDALDKNFFTNIKPKIEILENKINKYELKINEVISKKTTKLKKINEKMQTKAQSIIEKIKDKKNKKLDNFNNQKETINNLSKILNENKQKKLENSSNYQQLLKINEDLQNKKTESIFVEEKLSVIKPKILEKINILEEKTSNFSLKKLGLQVKLANSFGVVNKQKTFSFLLNLLNESKLLVLIFVVAIIAGISNKFFFTERTWVNLITNNLDLLMIAFGMTLIILTGGIDLSVGSVLAFGGACSIKFLSMGINPYAVILICILICAIFGVASGYLISYTKLQPFIVTLILMLCLRGGATILLASKVAPMPPNTLQFLTAFKIGIMPISFFILLVFFLFVSIVMRFYKYGRYIYAIGGNIKAARLSGLRTQFLNMSVYIFSNCLVALGALIYISKLNSISPNAGTGIELDAISCVALGGTSLLGGKGGIGKTLIGWFVISVLATSMNLIGIDPYYQMIVKGCVILLAVLSDKKVNLYKKLLNNYKLLIYRI